MIPSVHIDTKSVSGWSSNPSIKNRSLPLYLIPWVCSSVTQIYYQDHIYAKVGNPTDHWLLQWYHQYTDQKVGNPSDSNSASHSKLYDRTVNIYTFSLSPDSKEDANCHNWGPTDCLRGCLLQLMFSDSLYNYFFPQKGGRGLPTTDWSAVVTISIMTNRLATLPIQIEQAQWLKNPILIRIPSVQWHKFRIDVHQKRHGSVLQSLLMDLTEYITVTKIPNVVLS